MPKRLGFWRNHEYKRRAVSKDVTGFVGWKKIVELASQFKGSTKDRDRALYSATFLTGGRIGEVLLLRRDNFEVTSDEVIVRRMRLFKRYEKTGEWFEYVDEKPENRLARLYKWDREQEKYFRRRYETKTKIEYRSDFSFPANEPLASILIDWIERSDDYLFKGYKGDHLSYIRAYQIFRQVKIDENTHLYPHWLRAQRASCIISFYGFKMEEMMEWMGWEELSTARMYAKFGLKTLTSKMMNRTYPKEAIELERKFI